MCEIDITIISVNKQSFIEIMTYILAWLWLAVNDETCGWTYLLMSHHSCCPALAALAALRSRQGCLIKKNLLLEAIILVAIRPNFDSSLSKHDRFCWGPWGNYPKCPLVNPILYFYKIYCRLKWLGPRINAWSELFDFCRNHVTRRNVEN